MVKPEVLKRLLRLEAALVDLAGVGSPDLDPKLMLYIHSTYSLLNDAVPWPEPFNEFLKAQHDAIASWPKECALRNADMLGDLMEKHHEQMHAARYVNEKDVLTEVPPRKEGDPTDLLRQLYPGLFNGVTDVDGADLVNCLTDFYAEDLRTLPHSTQTHVVQTQSESAP